jgi:hypothetical protein
MTIRPRAKQPRQWCQRGKKKFDRKTQKRAKSGAEFFARFIKKGAELFSNVFPHKSWISCKKTLSSSTGFIFYFFPCILLHEWLKKGLFSSSAKFNSRSERNLFKYLFKYCTLDAASLDDTFKDEASISGHSSSQLDEEYQHYIG